MANDQDDSSSSQNSSDPSAKKVEGGGTSDHHKLIRMIAHPVDRLAAFFVDFGISACLLFLASTPFKRKIMIFDLSDQAELVDLWILFSFLTLVIVGTSYQALFLRFFGGTPGKLLFGLRVVDFWSGSKPSLKDAYLRSFVWWFNTALFFVPHLGVISNKNRRPMHDRLGDTVVVSINGRAASYPSIRESLVAQSLTALVLGIVCAVVATEAFRLSTKYSFERGLFDQVSDEFRKCELVSEAQDRWPEEATRLEIAISLHAASLVDDECLDKEAQTSFMGGREVELSYLARAFVVSGQPSLSDSYLEKTCEVAPTSGACKFSEIIVLWTEKKWDEATEKFNQIIGESPVYVKVWAVKHFERIEDYAYEQELLDHLWAYEPLAKFVNSHLISAFWGQGKREQARVAYRSVLNTLEEDERIGLSSWFCLQELKTSCSKQVIDNCAPFSNFTSAQSEPLEGEMFALTEILLAECQGAGQIDTGVGSRLSSNTAVELLYGIQMLKEKKNDKARLGFKDIIASIDDTKSLLKIEATERLTGIATESDLEEIETAWRDSEPTLFGWKNIGRGIFDRHLALKNERGALNVGQTLVNYDLGNQALVEDLVLLAYEMKSREYAWSLIKAQKSYEESIRYQETSVARSPASRKKFDEVRMKLEREFGGL
jgi:uncharacterized RDD family membrane protein YckC/tetratricopeptide (TPR) repeat protein